MRALHLRSLLPFWALLCLPLQARRTSLPIAALETGQLNTAAAGRVALPSIGQFAEVCQIGLEAVNDGVSKFMEAPPDVAGGIDVLREKLWEIAEVVLTAEQLGSKEFAQTKGRWDKAFESLSTTSSLMQEVYFTIQGFQSTGNTTALREALFKITEVPFQVLKDVFPDAAIYYDAVHGLVDSAGRSWSLFFSGKPEDAVIALWEGFNASMREVLPDSLVNNAAFETVMGTVDGVLGDLNKHVIDYKRQIMESTVCYKNFIARGKVRPSVCREGFVWSGGHRCLPLPSNGADCFMPCGYREGECPGFCREKKACCKRGQESPKECLGAYGFIDRSFTEGNSKQYHQCVYKADAGLDTSEDTEMPDSFLEDDADLDEVHDEEDLAQDAGSLLEEGDDDFDEDEDAGAAFLGTHDAVSSGMSSGDRGYTETDTEDELGVGQHRWNIPFVHRRRQIKGAYTAKCNMSTEYNEKHSNERYCVSKCPKGFHPKNSDKCEQLCDSAGKFKADGKFVCGMDPGEVTKTYMEMGTAVVWQGVQIGTLVADMYHNGMDVDKLYKTITAFIEMGKPFARPMCPMVEALLPDPNAAGAQTVAFKVENCGTAALNGNWVKKGWTRDRPRYEKIGREDAVIEWSDSRKAWRMYIDESLFGFGRTTLYVNRDNSVAMPTGEWEAVDGALPAPTVVA